MITERRNRRKQKEGKKRKERGKSADDRMISANNPGRLPQTPLRQKRRKQEVRAIPVWPG
jgi:hypothetical protein